MATRKPTYTIVVDDELFQKIEDFRYENRYPSRSAATVELIRIGMDVLMKEMEEKKAAKPEASDEKD